MSRLGEDIWAQRNGFNEGAVTEGLFLKVGTGTAGVLANDTAGGPCVGVSGHTYTASELNRSVRVKQGGFARVTSGAAVAVGASVSSDAAGKAITATTGHVVQGVAMEAAGGADETIIVDLQPGNRNLAT